MYRGRLWTMRMFAGFGTPEQANERFKYLLSQGQTGLSTAFDFPTLMGYDSDSQRALGEVGVCGVAVDTLRDMEVLFADIPLARVTTSMTINGPAVVLLAPTSPLPTYAAYPGARSEGPFKTTASKSSSRSTRGSCPATRDARRDRHDRILHTRSAAVEHRQYQRLSHPRSRGDGAQELASLSPTESDTCSPVSSEGWTSTTSQPRCKDYFSYFIFIYTKNKGFTTYLIFNFVSTYFLNFTDNLFPICFYNSVLGI